MDRNRGRDKNRPNTDSDSDLDSEWSSENNAGANFASFARQLQYDKTSFYGQTTYFAPYSTIVNRAPANELVDFGSLPDDALKPYGKTKFETARKDTTSLFLIDSKNRDKTAFPQPTSFTLKPPRVYKKVTSIQVTQIKLLSSFFYFRFAKGNTFLPVIERGRENLNSFLEFPLTEAIQISEGSYNISELLNTLQIQMNYTPLFYDFPTEFSGFVNAFTTNGDLSVNFNQPGDTYYDALNKKYVTNPTMDQITSYYWGSRYAGLSQYTIDQVKVGYYYPVLYELLLDIQDTAVYPLLDLKVPESLLSDDQGVYTHVIFNSSGINDPIVLYLINININLLDKYRLKHTFRFSLINRYQLAYDTNSLRVNIVSISLNTSLVNLININIARNLASAIQNAGVTSAQFSNTSNVLNQAKVIYTDMYNYIQRQLTNYFAVGYATYASDYFLNTNNVIFIQNGLNASGVRTGYTTEYLTSGQTPIASTVTEYTNSPGYWPNFISVNTTQGSYGGGINSDGINPSLSMIPYSLTASNFQFGLQTIDPSTFFIQTNRSSRSVDCVISVKPATYTVFKFRSQTRQTLQVETLPLPYYYRFADYNQQGFYKGVLDTNNSNVPQKFFSTPYTFEYSTINRLMDSSNYSTLILKDVASMPFQTAFAASPTLPLNVQANYMQFEFNAPWPPGILSTGLYAYNTTISFVGMSNLETNISTNLVTPVSAFIYHDRGAFMADIATAFKRKENPLHYIKSNSATTTQSDLTMQISTFSGQKYYGIFRSQNLSFGNMFFRPVVYTDTKYINIETYSIPTDYPNFSPLANPYAASNLDKLPFVSNYNTNYIRLPVQSSLQGIDPSDPKYATNVSVKGKPIGYDISGVSNDLTDYRGYTEGQLGFVPNSIFRIDPRNYFTFQSITPFDSNAGSYFGGASENAILQPITSETYSYKGTSSAQIKIVHWYDDYYIPKQIEDIIPTTNTIGFSESISSASIVLSTILPVNSNSEVQFGTGINAIGFLPTDGLYDVSSFSFKSAIYPLQCISTTAEDPNTRIKYMGVFTGAYLASRYISLSSALTVLTFSKSQVYGPSTLALTPGFGIEKGTWYEYGYDPSFVAASNVNINGYTQGSNELLSYDSMYYMVPFNSDGSNITFSYLTGSLVPYPLSQVVSTGEKYFGQTAKSVGGTLPQKSYIIPSTIANAFSDYGPQGLIPYTQSQYEQSQPIMTNSIGFREFQKLVENEFAIFPFTTTFSNSLGSINKQRVGLTTFTSEYSDNFYLVNSLSNYSTISNAGTSFQGALYASSISTSIGRHGGTTASMQYLVHPFSTLNNYSYNALSNLTRTFLFETMDNNNPNITLRKLELDLNTPIVTVWLWGGGGATWFADGNVTGPFNYTGGAGAYAKAKIDVKALIQQTGFSTLYMVVGKGGNRDNFTFGDQIQQYAEPKYGGGGTSIMEVAVNMSYTDNISLQGGGFSGIFFGSNVMDSQPLIIVGGGGAGGAYTMGGPGGFGIEPIPLPVDTFKFSEIKFTNVIAPRLNLVSVFDWDDVNNYPGQFDGARSGLWGISQDSNADVGRMLDEDLVSFYSPRYTTTNNGNVYSSLNPAVFPVIFNEGTFPMPCDTIRFSLNFNSNVSTISKVRMYSLPTPYLAQKPTGYIVYNDTDKAQMLYSNTSFPFYGTDGIIQDFNGAFTASGKLLAQQVIDMPFTGVRSNTVNNTNGWLTCGVATSQYDTIQYSLDGSNWANIRSQTGLRTPLTTTRAVRYASIPSSNGGGYWYACGSNTIMRSSNGLDWTGIYGGSYDGSLTSLAVGTDRIVAGGTSNAGTSFLVTTNGLTWSLGTGGFSNGVSRIRFINGLFWAMGPSDTVSLKYSTNGSTWSNMPVGSGIAAGALDIAYNPDTFTYVVAMGTGAQPEPRQIKYCIAVDEKVVAGIPVVWTAVDSTNLANFTCNTVSFGNGLFVAAGSTSDGSSPAKWSSDGISWYDTDIIPQTAGGAAHAASLNRNPTAWPVTGDMFHMAGTQKYYFIEGYHYKSANDFRPLEVFLSGLLNIIINEITYDGDSGQFISMGRGSQYDWVNNCTSIFKSGNGINWKMTNNGGFYNRSLGGTTREAYSGNYGSLSIIPNLSTLYIEMFIASGTRPYFAEFQAFGTPEPFLTETPANTVSTIYDSQLDTYWKLQDTQVNTYAIKEYNFTLQFSTPVQLLSKLELYVPTDATRYFTGLLMNALPTSKTVYDDGSISAIDFDYDVASGRDYYNMYLIPALSNVSTLYLTVKKSTPGAVQLYEIKGVNDQNQPIISYTPTSVVDAGGYPKAPGVDTATLITNIIDTNLDTEWQSGRPNSETSGSYTDPPDIGAAIYKLNFTFSPKVERMNYIQIYNGPYQNLLWEFSGVVVYTDSNKTNMLYSNTSGGRQPGDYTNNDNDRLVSLSHKYLEYNRFSFFITPVVDITQIYIEIYKNFNVNGNVLRAPRISQITFTNIGRIVDTPAGYTGGRFIDMQRITLATRISDGGGGSNGIGGTGGSFLPGSTTRSNGLEGLYLTGGSPATAGQSAGMTSYSNIKYGAGGGGGGYYGGGGGGIASTILSSEGVYAGGAGGGGAGFFLSTNFLTLLDYGVAIPGNISTNIATNYIPPRITEQSTLIAKVGVPQYNNTYGYGAGGRPTESYAQGQHGAIVVNFDAPIVVNPIGNAEAIPSYVDGSRLSVFKAPITYESDTRTLPFTTYADSIQSSQYSNYNWVWYKAFLSLTGATLSPLTMRPSSSIPRNPTEFPNLPSIVYNALERQFANVSSFFGGISTISDTVISGIQIGFELFNQYFIQTSYTEQRYIEMTEIYCLLDYLRQSDNLVRPHIDPLTAPLSRVFGGLPRFGYWANPFLTNVSYVGFDIGPSLFAPAPLAAITGSSNPVQAAYGLVLEQSISSGIYTFKDIMAYKPTVNDASNYGSNWLTVTQFNESYVIRTMINLYAESNIPVQPYTAKSAIEGKLPLFNYKVYTTPITVASNTIDGPIHMINDFQGNFTYFYSFLNKNLRDMSTIHMNQIALTSSIIQINQRNITSLANTASNIIGTVVSEYNSNAAPSTLLQAISRFGFNLNQFASIDPITQKIQDTLIPVIEYSRGQSNYYNSYSINSELASRNVGKALTDYLGNIYAGDRSGGYALYENVCTIQIYQQSFSNRPLALASPSFILSNYNSGTVSPYHDFLISRYTNLWQLQGTSNLSTIYGARLESPYDFTVRTNFVNQLFYPTHKIILTQKGTSENPMTVLYDLSNYPSYNRSEMFFYRNFSSLVRDISGQFALEKSSNFAYADTKFSGYFFNSYIQNINMLESRPLINPTKDDFNYLAIRAYSPSESYKALVRFYLPGRYDFGYISLKDLSNEVLTLQNNSNVNPDYLTVLGEFTSTFAINRVFGGTGLAGFNGSNITSVTFGDFLRQYKTVSDVINSNAGIVSSIGGTVLQGTKALITGDLQYIIPAYVANRERVYDPLEFKLPFSTVAQASNRKIDEYSMGYNLGFAQRDTPYATAQRAGSFFKILDDYIYMKLNEEHNMNTLDISRRENFATTHDTQAESKLYNCKLMLNNFGTYATTLVQNPVFFNPPIGKLDKLTFTWYDPTGAVIDNTECEWSGAIQVVESVDTATNDSTIPKM